MFHHLHQLQYRASKFKTLDISKKHEDQPDGETRQWPLQQLCAHYISALVVEIVDSIQKVLKTRVRLGFDNMQLSFLFFNS